jgi:hypothetical protein
MWRGQHLKAISVTLCSPFSYSVFSRKDKQMKNIKFVVKVNRGGTRAPEYVQRVDSTPVQMTTNRRLALLMGRLTAEDAVKSIQTSRRIPELMSVQVGA